jgi:hypothetical protein
MTDYHNTIYERVAIQTQMPNSNQSKNKKHVTPLKKAHSYEDQKPIKPISLLGQCSG